MRRWRGVGACLVLGWTCLGAIGCVGMHEVKQARDQAIALRDQLNAESARWEEAALSMAPDDPDKPAAEARAALARAQAASVEAGAAGVDLALAEANNPSGMVGSVLEFVLPFAPAPVRAPLVLGLAAAGAIVRSVQLRRGLVSVVRGINAAIREDDAFASRFKAHADTFRATQTDAAKRIIDGVVGRGVTARGA